MYTNIKNRLYLCLQTCCNVLIYVMEQNKKICKIVKVTLTSHLQGKC